MGEKKHKIKNRISLNILFSFIRNTGNSIWLRRQNSEVKFSI